MSHEAKIIYIALASEVLNDCPVFKAMHRTNMLRPLGSFEHCFWLVNRGVASHIVFAAEIDGVATEPKWRAAFDALQRRHPLLHVRGPASPLGLPFSKPCMTGRSRCDMRATRFGT